VDDFKDPLEGTLSLFDANGAHGSADATDLPGIEADEPDDGMRVGSGGRGMSDGGGGGGDTILPDPLLEP
jgi:hypothetical protein